jgi:hypothetical protein
VLHHLVKQRDLLVAGHGRYLRVGTATAFGAVVVGIVVARVFVAAADEGLEGPYLGDDFVLELPLDAAITTTATAPT